MPEIRHPGASLGIFCNWRRAAVPHTGRLVQFAARGNILHGALALADAVRSTLGPKSRGLFIEKKRKGTP